MQIKTMPSYYFAPIVLGEEGKEYDANTPTSADWTKDWAWRRAGSPGTTLLALYEVSRLTQKGELESHICFLGICR